MVTSVQITTFDLLDMRADVDRVLLTDKDWATQLASPFVCAVCRRSIPSGSRSPCWRWSTTTQCPWTSWWRWPGWRSSPSMPWGRSATSRSVLSLQSSLRNVGVAPDSSCDLVHLQRVAQREPGVSNLNTHWGRNGELGPSLGPTLIFIYFFKGSKPFYNGGKINLASPKFSLKLC